MLTREASELAPTRCGGGLQREVAFTLSLRLGALLERRHEVLHRHDPRGGCRPSCLKKIKVIPGGREVRKIHKMEVLRNSSCGCIQGICDEWRGICECPLGFEGPRCERNLLPACMLGDYALPIRSWVLHAFHDSAGHKRWPGGVRTIGPVPCQCLQQLVAAPFLIERSRLKYMRGFHVKCIELPPSVRLSAFIANPAVFATTWRRFSFAAAHDSLQVGVEPALRGAPLDGEHPRVGRLVRQVKKRRAASSKQAGPEMIMYPVELLHPITPALLSGDAQPLPLLPLSRCPTSCGGRGWCEMSVGSRDRSGAWRREPRCGCFVPGGLKAGVGGATCAAPSVWLASEQPNPHRGPSCLRECAGLGVCDWQGFCNCPAGTWGLDCGIGWSPDRRRHAASHPAVLHAADHVEAWADGISSPPALSTVASLFAAAAKRGGSGHRRRSGSRRWVCERFARGGSAFALRGALRACPLHPTPSVVLPQAAAEAIDLCGRHARSPALRCGLRLRRRAGTAPKRPNLSPPSSMLHLACSI